MSVSYRLVLLVGVLVFLGAMPNGYADLTITREQASELAVVARELRMPGVDVAPIVTRNDPNHGTHVAFNLTGPRCAGVLLQTNDVYERSESTTSIVFDDTSGTRAVVVDYLFSESFFESRVISPVFSYIDPSVRISLGAYERKFSIDQRQVHRQVYQTYVALRDALRAGHRDSVRTQIRRMNEICGRGHAQMAVGTTPVTDRVLPREHGVAAEGDASQNFEPPVAEPAR